MSANLGAQGQFSREDDGPILGAGGWHLASCLLLIFGIIVAVAMWKRHDHDLQRIAIGIVAVCAIPIATTIFRLTRLLKKIGRAELMLPSEYLPLAFSGTATYVRPLRGGAALESVEARLQCEEELTKGKGKNQRTWNKVVHDEELKPVPAAMMNEIRVQIPFRIPETGPPSINTKGAVTRWVIRMRLRMRDCPNTRSSFVLDVFPAVVKR
ncbi:MAG: hypothetical protein ACXV7D_06325 [Thermoanaerobaculia bacterium]